MKIEINLSHKMIFAVAAVSVVLVISLFVFAAETTHYLSQIVKDDGVTKIDSNNDGIVDEANLAIYARTFDSSIIDDLPDTGGMDGEPKETAEIPDGCVYLDNEDYHPTGKWMSCDTGYYMAAISDDYADHQDAVCCPFPGLG